MWKNWRQPQAPATQSNIISYDDYYDDDRYLETIHEVESIRERPQSVAHPPAALPELPFRAVPPLHHEHDASKNGRIPSSVYSTDPAQRNSRIASSLYSQPSPTYPPENIQTTIVPRKESVGNDISPVSTPRSTNFPIGSDTTISPIEPTFSAAARAPLPENTAIKNKSRLPQPVSSTSTDNRTPPNQREKKRGTKWDEYSGEQTAADTGKRGSVRLGPDQLEMQFPQLKERTRQILAGLRDADSKKSTWGRQPPPVDDSLDAPVQQRPPWKGASGREAVVDPVRNTPAARKGPLVVPQRNVSRSNPVALANARTESPEVTAVPDSTAGEPADLQPVQEPSPKVEEVSTPRQDHSIRMVPSQESVVKPIAPLKTRQMKVKSQTDPGENTPLQSPFQSPPGPTAPRSRAYETNQGSNETSVPTNDHNVHPSTPPRRSSLGPNQRQGHQGQHLDPTPNKDDVSRFSWTTYATTVNSSPTTMAATVDNSPVPPMPFMPSSQAPMMVKARAASTSASRTILPYSNSEGRFSTASIVSRKPIGDKRRSASLQSSTAKDLPPPPPQEMTPGDKITVLETRQSHLATRKRNNSRIRTELTETLKRNAITYDIYKRREVETRIKELERERDEIVQEEYDVGVQLHRAQKKRDNADEYGRGTALWINRVTQ